MAYSEYIDYRIIAENAERRVFDILHSLEWQLHSEKKAGSIFRMQCSVTDSFIYRYEGMLRNKTTSEVAALIHPEGLYRNKWDSQSGGTNVVERISEDTAIIRHITKPRFMGLVSARDTIDLCQFKTDPTTDSRHVVLSSVLHPSAPEQSGIIRAHTHPSLLLIESCNSDTKVTALLHAELHLVGIPTSIKDALMPKGITGFFEDLINFADKTHKINIDQTVTGWL